MDPFHVVAWATDALDVERRASWNRARRQAADPDTARALKDSRFALWKNEADLTDRQAAKLTWIAATDPRLHRAWRLKEALRAVFTLAKTRPTAALSALDCWIGWVRRCRIDSFVDLQRRIRRHHQAIRAALTTGMSNGLIGRVGDWRGGVVRTLRFQPPPHRSVHAVLPHTAHRRRSPAAFGLSRQGRFGLGATTIPTRSTRARGPDIW